MSQHFTASILTAAVLAATAMAQSTACLPVGVGGAVGCQSSANATLTNGVVATGGIEFDYDATTARLVVTIDNDSPIVGGETNPVITRIGFNFPAGAVDRAELVGQSAAGGATPDFVFGRDQGMGCLGQFGAVLSIQGIRGGIGNPDAPTHPHPTTVLAPAEFDFQLAGPGVGGLTAADFAESMSSGGNPSVAVAFKFQGGGVDGEESGWVSSGGVCCPREARVLNYGQGCAPQGVTVPALTSIGAPIVGDPVGVDISSPSTAGGAGLLVYGFSSTFDPLLNRPLPIDLGPFGFSGCSLLASSEFSIAVVLDGAGEARHTIAIPPLAKWCGREISFQALLLTGSNELATSTGLTAVLGS